jgi:hypothetical protein
MASKITTIKRTIACPQECCAGQCAGESVVWTFGSQVTVAPCSALLAQGWTGIQLALRHEQADRYMPIVSAGWQHRDGLVVIA